MFAKVLLVALGGAVGAVCRYLLTLSVDRWMMQHWPAFAFPFGILSVNLLACILIGLLFGTMATRSDFASLWHPLLLVGVLGSFSTFSTFSLDALQLLQSGRAGAALLYVALSVVTCIGGTFIGLRLTS